MLARDEQPTFEIPRGPRNDPIDLDFAATCADVPASRHRQVWGCARSGKVSSQPSQSWADHRFLMPPPLHHRSADRPQPITHPRRRRRVQRVVLAGSGLLVQEMRTSQAHQNFWVVSQMDRHVRLLPLSGVHDCSVSFTIHPGNCQYSCRPGPLDRALTFGHRIHRAIVEASRALVRRWSSM